MDRSSDTKLLFIFPSSLGIYFILLYLLTFLAAVSSSFLLIYCVINKAVKIVTVRSVRQCSIMDDNPVNLPALSETPVTTAPDTPTTATVVPDTPMQCFPSTN